MGQLTMRSRACRYSLISCTWASVMPMLCSSLPLFSCLVQDRLTEQGGFPRPAQPIKEAHPVPSPTVQVLLQLGIAVPFFPAVHAFCKLQKYASGYHICFKFHAGHLLSWVDLLYSVYHIRVGKSRGMWNHPIRMPLSLCSTSSSERPSSFTG